MQTGFDVILNAGSGGRRAEELRQFIAEQFRAQGVEANILLAGSGKDLAALAQRAREDSSEVVVAAGGDGTINAVASALVGTGKSLGVLPVGTFNYFAKNLGIPLDLAEAVGTAARRHTAEVDLAEVNGRIILNNASIGLYPSIIRQREQEYRRWGRRQLVAYAAVARALFQGSPFLGVHISAGGEELPVRTPLVFVGSNKYQIEEFGLPGGECVGRGELAIYVARPTGWTGLMLLAVQALLGRLHGERRLQLICTEKARVTTRRPRLPVALDGEVLLLETPLRFATRPAALKVIVPEERARDLP
ncbi:MAG: diacylglycerol kinase family protein [Pyrinomonadaceae bacterium]